jgi:hypothetical protein
MSFGLLTKGMVPSTSSHVVGSFDIPDIDIAFESEINISVTIEADVTV